VIGIGGKRLVVPIFGVVIAAKLATRVTEQRCHVRIVVIAHGAQRGDAASKVALIVDERIGGVIAVEEILGRAVLSFLVFCLVVEPDGLLLCGGVGLLEPIAAANSGAPETVAANITAASKGVLRMGSSGFVCQVPWSLNFLLGVEIDPLR